VPVDPNIALAAGTGVGAPPNPLKQFGDFLQMQSAVNQQKLFPGQLQEQQFKLQQAQLDQTRNRMGTAIANLAPLAAGDDVTHAKLFSAIGGLKAAGLPTDEIEKDIAANMPDGDGPEFKKWARGFAARALPPSQVPGEVVGTPSTENVGGQLVPTMTGGRYSGTPGGKTVQPGSLTLGPSPSEQNDLKQVWDPVKKQFVYVRNGDVAPLRDGNGNPIAPSGGGSAIPGLPQSGRVNPPAGASPTPGEQSGATVPMGTAEEVTSSASHAGAARERANNYQSTIFPIEGAITALNGADTGKGAEVLNNIRGYLGDTPLKYFSGFLPSTLSDQEKRNLFDEAKKYTTGMAVGGPGGSRSDAGAEASAASNPNVHISNAAAVAVAKSILAQRRMEQSGTLSFNNSGKPVGEYDRYMNQWATQQDPRAFMVDKMSPEDRAALVKSMGGVNSPAYKKFRNSYLSGVQAGVIPSHDAGG
jgi:hypothetical protein